MNIRGKNIELRAVEPDDYKKLAEILSDHAVALRMFGHASKLGDSFSDWLLSATAKKNAYYFTVKETENFNTIGICAYQDIDYRNGSVTLWAVIGPDYDKDYGVQTFNTLAKNAFEQLRMEHIAIYCFENDYITISQAKGAGFTHDVVMYSRVKKGEDRLNLELFTLLKEEVGL